MDYEPANTGFDLDKFMEGQERTFTNEFGWPDSDDYGIYDEGEGE